jgi:hypothetical protein
MTALEAVSVYLPPAAVPIESLAAPLGLTDMQVKLFRRFHGLSHVGRDPEASLTSLLLKAAAGLEALHGQEHRVRTSCTRGRCPSSLRIRSIHCKRCAMPSGLATRSPSP